MMFSSDTAGTSNQISKAIELIKNSEVDIILGTQIVAKGHNFDNLNLVVVTCVDAMLYGEDFRSIEKAFQTLYQVSGRAGRVGNTDSKVIIQTYNPDEKLMTILEKNDVEQLYSIELQNRKLTGMPPFGKMASITISALSETETKEFTQQLLRSMPRTPSVRIFGAIQPSLYKLKSRYKLKILLLSQSGLQQYIKKIDILSKIPRNIKVSIDIDPYDFA
jgi:primosomal protein N' (replication factor Y)